MAERRRKNARSSQSEEPAPKRAATNPSSSAANLSQSNSLLSPAAISLRRRPICAGRFGGSYFSPTSSTAQAAARTSASNAFSRAAFAKLLVQRYKESHEQAVAGIGRSSERAPRISEEITRQKIGIIGAGMAGLYAALVLDSLGFTNYEILEANPNRAGGRVFTRYFNDGPTSALNSKWNYIDFGAMRFPGIEIMDRVIGTTQTWSLTNYLNSVTKEDHLKIKLLDYHLSVENNIQYYNSTRKTNAELEKEEPDPLSFGKSKGGGLDDKYVKTWYTTWLDPAFDSFKEKMHADFNAGFLALMEKDNFSVRAYLRTFIGPDKGKYPQELIDYLETLDSATGHYDDAFTEAVMDSFDFDSPTNPGEDSVQWKCVEGGTSRFVHAMLSVIKSKPEMNKRVTKIAPSSTSKGDIDVFVQAAQGRDVQVEARRTYHHVINTLPPAVLRSLDTAECNFSYEKRTALRVLRVDSSIKIGLLFKSRWWQDEKVMRGKPIFGGQSSTDLPVRNIVYPSYGIEDPDAPGVLIASYPWGQDAARISALAAGEPAQLVQLAISNIATVHDLPITFLQEQYTGQYFIQDWDQYEYSQGAFALFGPGQFTSLFPGLIEPEMDGRYHTAGEMSSVHHAWIVGALNSAWRCVYEILQASGATEKIRELKEKWGEVDEVDMGNI
eukprot:c24744_g1_i1 orf=171-2174(-)